MGATRTEHHYDFPRPPAEVWASLVRVDRYRDWWPWLASFDAGGFDAGQRWRCAVRPPLPYTVHFEVLLEEVEAPRFVTATVTGDITGPAAIDLRATPSGGTDLRLVASLAPSAGLLRAATAIAGPVVRWGHDWVLATGLRQFRQRAF